MMKFKLNNNEEKLADCFIEKHKASCQYSSGATPHYAYIFIPTGIGNICKIECTRCKEQEDITDYDCW